MRVSDWVKKLIFYFIGFLSLIVHLLVDSSNHGVYIEKLVFV